MKEHNLYYCDCGKQLTHMAAEYTSAKSYDYYCAWCGNKYRLIEGTTVTGKDHLIRVYNPLGSDASA